MLSTPTLPQHQTTATRNETELTYRLDAGLTITSLDDAWSRFATENGAPQLAAPAPIGKPILSCISDPTTRRIYQDVFAATRRRGQMSFPIRCDSPSLRRFLRLSINATEDGGFLIRSAVLKVEARQPLSLLEASDRQSDEFLTCCSWCKRFDVRGRWEEVEVAIEQLRLFDQARLPWISHGMCAACRDAMEQQLAG